MVICAGSSFSAEHLSMLRRTHTHTYTHEVHIALLGPFAALSLCSRCESLQGERDNQHGAPLTVDD